MKILQALFFPPEQPGGVSSMVPYIQERFNRMAGWQMELFSLPKRVRGKGTEDLPFRTFDPEQYAGHPIVDRYLQTIRDYLWWTRMRMKGQEQYDLIHAHHPIAALALKHLYPDIPMLATIHSSYERELSLNGKIQPNGPEQAFLVSLYRELEANCDQLITVSEAFRQYMTPFLEQPERVKVIRNGFDQKRFRPISHDTPVPQLVTLCRLVPAKGLDVLLEACARLKQSGKSFVLHIIGDGDIREELEEMAEKLDIYEETIFYGYMLHPEQFMPFFDIFVLPSRAEAFGNVFAEAALCWLALVGTDVGGISEQIEHGKNGLLVPVDDVDALAGALERLLEDPQYRHELARAANERANKTYSLARVIRELKEVYREYGQ
ncbi:glycosyltransferase family 1 protein [Xylanibacillus composti]|uniref:Glycosyltransferase involved in cell wall biosynthesis n=1 Tax=Xylanibacillus composti TaxID=1572762 RepID=A0A8J4H7Q5_9BACL|nr:glycosyltransferase family 4 protein [Xylanibacillus composti]MDT9725003.1 glycosyltransferase family 1 protein [Xylanibacillus composti]GIQ71296.1 hypothetical protein XYCOK13_41200 [Xylanibacillus composti]